MSQRGRTRALSAEERRLWAHVARAAKPLKGKAHPPEPEPEPSPAPAPALRPAASPFAPTALRSRPDIPPLAPLERDVVAGLRRRKRALDSVIDLHGMRQAEAHGSLVAFLHRAQAAGHTVVLVVTGKGGAASGEGLFDERGVLRRVVPHWLRLPDVRPLVLGFEEAAPHHGGAGALYVRLRRRRAREG
jgi:DNA-nicking Smr family endonuclease